MTGRGLVDQLGRSPVLQTGGLGFKSRPVHSYPDGPDAGPLALWDPKRIPLWAAGASSS